MRYLINDSVFVRYPMLAYRMEEILKLSSLEGVLSFWKNDELFRKAVFIASPDLYDRAEKIVYKDNQNVFNDDSKKVLYSLYKYALRISCRSTPFGLFSAIGVATLLKKENKYLASKSKQKTLSITLDYEFSCQLAKHLTIKYGKKRWFRYTINNTVVKQRNEYQFLENHPNKGVNQQYISSINREEESDFIFDFLIERSEFSVQDLETIVSIHSFDVEEIIDELLRSSIIFPYYGPHILNDDAVFIEEVMNSPIEEFDLEFLKKIHMQLSIERIEEISIESLKQIQSLSNDFFGQECKRMHVFHFDSCDIVDVHCAADKLFPRSIEIMQLQEFFIQSENSRLNKFKEDFLRKYENEMVPLWQVFDPKRGLESVYSNLDRGDIFDNLVIGGGLKGKSISLEKEIKSRLFVDVKTKEIYLRQKNTNKKLLLGEKMDNIISVFFKPVLIDNKTMYVVYNVDNINYTNFISRFSIKNAKVEELCDQYVKNEGSQDNVIFAEVNYLPNDKLGNVLKRRPYRGYVISLAGKVPFIENIPISSLYLGVKDGCFYLFSQKHNKQVIPIVSSAFNRLLSNSALFSFLSDLSEQHYRGLPSVEDIMSECELTYCPRVLLGNVILLPRTWMIYESKDFLSDDKDVLIKALKKLDIPSRVMISSGDNSLIIDFENDLSINLFRLMLKQGKWLLLKEYIEDKLFEVENGKKYPGEVVAAYVRKE